MAQLLAPAANGAISVASRRRGPGAGRIATHAILILASLSILIPVLWTFRTSFGTRDLAFRPGELWFSPTFDNYRKIFVEQSFQTYLWNSLWIGVATALVCLLLGSLAAYSIARYRTGGTVLSLTILGTQMLPAVTLIIPLWVLIRRQFELAGREIAFFDRGWTLVAVYLSFNLPFVVWILIGFFQSIPYEIEEAARVDGATPFQAFRQVVIPVSLPGLLAAGVFAFVLSWNEFFFALNLTGREARTMPVALASLMTSQGNQVGAICAATIAMMLPIVLLTWVIQRFLVRGLTFGAVK